MKNRWLTFPNVLAAFLLIVVAYYEITDIGNISIYTFLSTVFFIIVISIVLYFCKSFIENKFKKKSSKKQKASHADIKAMGYVAGFAVLIWLALDYLEKNQPHVLGDDPMKFLFPIFVFFLILYFFKKWKER